MGVDSLAGVEPTGNRDYLGSLAGWGVIIFFFTFPFFGFFLFKGSFFLITLVCYLLFAMQIAVVGGSVWLPKSFYFFSFFFLLGPLSSFWAIDRSAALFGSLTLLLHLPIIYLTGFSFRKFSTRKLMTLFYLLPIILSLITIFLIIKFGNLRDLSGGAKETVGSFSNQSWSMAIVSLPFLVLMPAQAKATRIVKIITLAAIGFLCLASQSRSALALFALAWPLMFFFTSGHWLTRLSKITPYLTFAFIVSILLIWSLGIDGTVGVVIDRLQDSQLTSMDTSFDAKPDQADYGRTVMYLTGIEAIQAHPWLGIGYKGLKSYTEEIYGFGYTSHNVILTVWGEMGLPGLLGLLVLSAYLFVVHRKVINAKFWAAPLRDFASANLCALSLLLVMSQFRPFESNYMMSVCIGIALVFGAKKPPNQRNHEASRLGTAVND